MKLNWPQQNAPTNFLALSRWSSNSCWGVFKASEYAYISFQVNQMCILCNLPLFGFLELADFAAYEIALKGGDMVYVEDAVEMIDFVLESLS